MEFTINHRIRLKRILAWLWIKLSLTIIFSSGWGNRLDPRKLWWWKIRWACLERLRKWTGPQDLCGGLVSIWCGLSVGSGYNHAHGQLGKALQGDGKLFENAWFTFHTVCGLDICQSFKEKIIALFNSLSSTRGCRCSTMNLCYIPQAGLDIITAIEGEGHQSEKGSKIRRFSSPPRWSSGKYERGAVECLPVIEQ